MKKWILCASVYAVAACAHKPLSAHTPINEAAGMSSKASDADTYISDLYNQIDFSKSGKLNFDVFQKAMTGYLNLLNAGKIYANRHLLTVCDFTLSSSQYRLWILDLDQKKVVLNDFVAHGQGSGDEFATVFSNKNDSHQSSLGFYVTGETYNGGHGLSLKLHGQDNGFNSAAYDRGIVVHGADYVCKDFVAGNQRLGRSWGCPAVNSKISNSVINTIKGGTCLFIYYPNKQYLQTAYWLNKKVENLPDEAGQPQLLRLASSEKTLRLKPDTSNITAPASLAGGTL